MKRGDILRRLAEEVAGSEAVFSPNVSIALRIRTALSDPDCHIDEAARLVQAEPMLSARAVAMANSIAYNRSGREIADVRSAVARLGFQVLRNLAMAQVVRLMAQTPVRPIERDLAARLWDYTANVSALARLMAREVTRQDAETAAFAAIVHDLGGFYLLSRAAAFPDVLEGDSGPDDIDADIGLTRVLLANMGVPAIVVGGVEAFQDGFFSTPPVTLADTLLLAAHLSPCQRPWYPLGGRNSAALQARLDALVGGEVRQTVVDEASNAVRSLREVVSDAEDELRAMLAVMQY